MNQDELITFQDPDPEYEAKQKLQMEHIRAQDLQSKLHNEVPNPTIMNFLKILLGLGNNAQNT